LNRLEAEFHARHRLPRFEFVEACAPRLAEALEAHGFALENRPQLMVCPRGKERAAPAVNGLDIATLDAATALREFVAFLDVQRRAFGLPSARPPLDEEALSLRETLGNGFAFLARIASEPVATAMIQPPHDGLTELVGVSTLEAFRRRGIGGFLSFAAVRTAFDRGVSLAFLSAADARAGRVYEAAGFSPPGHSLFYPRPGDLTRDPRSDRRGLARARAAARPRACRRPRRRARRRAGTRGRIRPAGSLCPARGGAPRRDARGES